MHHLILLTGRQGAGKSTMVAPHFVDQFEFEKIAIGDPLKRISMQLNPTFFRPDQPTPLQYQIFGDNTKLDYNRLMDRAGHLAKKLPSLRKFWEDLGSTVREELGQDVLLVKSWRPRFDYFVEWAVRYQKPIRVIVDDVRLPNEPGYLAQLWWNTLAKHGCQDGARLHFVRVKSALQSHSDSELERHIDAFKVSDEIELTDNPQTNHDLLNSLIARLLYRRRNWEQL